MKVILYYNSGELGYDYKVIKSGDIDEAIEVAREINNHLERVGSHSQEGVGVPLEVPPASRLYFYLGDELVGSVRVYNSKLVNEYNHPDLLNLRDLFKAEAKDWMVDFFTSRVEEFSIDFESCILYAYVNGQSVPCKVVFEDTLQMTVDGYQSYQDNQTDDVARANAIYNDVSPLLARYATNTLNVCAVKYHDTDEDVYFIKNKFFDSLDDMLDKLDLSRVYSVAVNVKWLPVYYLLTKPRDKDYRYVGDYANCFEDVEAWNETVKNGRGTYFNSLGGLTVSYACRECNVTVKNGTLVPLDAGFFNFEKYKLSIVDWSDLTIKHLSGITQLGEATYDYQVESVTELDSEMEELYDGLCTNFTNVDYLFLGQIRHYYNNYIAELKTNYYGG